MEWKLHFWLSGLETHQQKEDGDFAESATGNNEGDEGSAEEWKCSMHGVDNDTSKNYHRKL